MSNIYFADIGAGLAASSSARANRDRRNYLAEERETEQADAPHIGALLKGDRTALDRVSPKTALKLAPYLQQMDAAQRTKAKEAAEYTASAANAILQADPGDRPAVYSQVVADGKARGFDLSRLPPQYSPQIDAQLRTYRSMAIPVLKHFENEGGGVQFAPPVGGGPAPAGGTPAAAIGGIESGGRYDAVGPDTGGGKRAYGKYQVMDFNVGPWTAEILGKSMTPQEFLANPQAQDAVFQAKFGEYTKRHGSPQAAARAWFAGEGGMNNPNAKDVLGTSVAGYEKKFTAGMGGAPVAQGDGGPPGSPAGDGGPPPAVQQLRGLQLPPGARVALQKGVPIVKDGAVLYIDANGGWGAAPLPSRAAPQQAPAGYEPNPEGGGLRPIAGGPADPAVAKKVGPMTEGQANAALYADRMRAAEKIILGNQEAGLSPVGKALEYVPGGNYAQSEGYQLYEQARRDFINAVLRRESGAVISDQEFQNAEKQYFPRPGDKPEVLKQKAANRATALEGISRAAGSSYKPEAAPAAPVAAPQAPAAQSQPQAAPPPQGAPAVGQVEQGYRFKGGNPADAQNWEPAQ